MAKTRYAYTWSTDFDEDVNLIQQTKNSLLSSTNDGRTMGQIKILKEPQPKLHSIHTM